MAHTWMLQLTTDKQLRQNLSGCFEKTIWRLRQDGKLPRPKNLGDPNGTPETDADTAIAKLLGRPTTKPADRDHKP